MIILKAILFILAFTLLAFIIIGLARTIKSQTSQNQDKFIHGKAPSPAPDGEYNGKVTGYKGSWRGKKFHASELTGVNMFEDSPGQMTERYNFKTATGVGIRDKDIQVVKIEYNIPGNPFWIRPVLDEIVETEPGHYLGKIHYRFIPGVPFTFGYFTLEAKQPVQSNQ
jgi:hypothetical protein